jgi:single-stranded-DNA-specific exonuclease
VSRAARWEFPRPADGSQVAAIERALSVGPIAARILAARGYTSVEAARAFLVPSFPQLHEALAMLDMDRAVARLAQAVRSGEKILIYGDYDVDGTASVALLSKAVELAGGNATWHVPHRLRDGYGMRPEVVETAAERGVGLIVSVDTGIRAAEVVRRAQELGIDVIVTDHHLPDSELPPAAAILNPNQPACHYPEKNLCGAGVAFKLSQALFHYLGWPEAKARRLGESFLKLAAIATVADVVPLTGENRVIVKLGLEGLREARHAGLRTLLEVAGVAKGTAPSAHQVAFQIAPRLNAAGRMDTARIAVELLLCQDEARSKELAGQLDDQNAGRRQVEDAILDACKATAVDDAARALVYYSSDWHRGVLGIVASRLVERHHRPVFVLGRNEDDGLVQGSGRSIPAFHLLEALEAMPDLFVRFGGHEHAAGVTLEAARVDEFRERLNAWAAARLSDEDLQPSFHIDAEALVEELSDAAAQGVLALAPFGRGNPAPLVVVRNAEVTAPPIVMKEKHLRLTLRQGGHTLKLKAWNFASRAGELEAGTRIDAAFTIEDDAWSAARGYAPWSATLRDVRPAAGE